MHRASILSSSPATEVASEGGADSSYLVISQAQTITALGEQVSSLKHQLEWFKRQVFGEKSERFAPQPDPTQMHLGEVFPVPSIVPETRNAVPTHTRRVAKTDMAGAETVPFFDESRVPVEIITVIDAKMKQLAPHEFELIGEPSLPATHSCGSNCASDPLF